MCMCACMYVCACMHACMHVCVHACMYVCMYVCVCMHACMHACVCACMHSCMHMCVCVCVHACMRVCMHTCMQNSQKTSKSWISNGQISPKSQIQAALFITRAIAYINTRIRPQLMCKHSAGGLRFQTSKIDRKKIEIPKFLTGTTRDYCIE